MALTKISLEIEVEDTFQNGNTLDLDAMYALLNEVAEAEYNRQFDANMLVRRFGMSMSGNGVAVASNATPSDVTDLVESGEAVTPTEALNDPVMISSRRKRRPSMAERVEAKLFLPR